MSAAAPSLPPELTRGPLLSLALLPALLPAHALIMFSPRCGLAGGTPWTTNAPEAGMYTNTTNAHHGKNGSTLPKLPTNTTWKIGGEATVTWQLLQNVRCRRSYRSPRPFSVSLALPCPLLHNVIRS